MRGLQRNRLLRLGFALLAGAVITTGVSLGGSVALAVGLLLALTLIAFALLTIAPDAIALKRRHYWRWWWRDSDDDGPFWPGTRIPRRPR